MFQNKPMQKTILLLLLIPCLVLLSACTSAPEAALAENPLTGMVYDNEGRPVQGVRIAIDGRDTALTDLNGRFVTPPLAGGGHSLTLKKAGYEETSVQVDFTSPLEVLYTRMTSFSTLLEEAEKQLDMHNTEEALALLERAAGIYPDDPALTILLLVCYKRLGDIQGIAGYSDRVEQLKIHPID